MCPATPDWVVANHPLVAKCVPRVSTIVDKMRTRRSCELEARFGRVVDAKFVPGVSRHEMDAIIDMLKHSSFVSGNDEWTESTDFLFMHEAKQMRTRVNYDSDRMQIQSLTIEKQAIDSVICHTTNHNADIRVALKLEHAVEHPPDVVNPFLVRIKQTRRFCIEGTKGCVWAYDFSLTWSGPTKTAAELVQLNGDAVFEIECELLNYTDYVYDNTDAYIATSILLKMTDLLQHADEYSCGRVHKAGGVLPSHAESSACPVVDPVPAASPNPSTAAP